MIKQLTFTKDWIQKIRDYYAKQKINADIQLIEKVIYAFYLLEMFSYKNIEFIFKGGTSLLLLLNNINRFSIDIDIVVEKQIDNLENIFNDILKDSKLFFNFEEDKRNSKTNIPKRHFKFYFSGR